MELEGSEEMKAAEAAQQRRHTLLTQQEDVIASQTRQRETLSQHLQQVPALPRADPAGGAAGWRADTDSSGLAVRTGYVWCRPPA